MGLAGRLPVMVRVLAAAAAELCSAHRGPAFGRCFIACFGFAALPPRRWRHPRTVFAGGGEYAAETGQVDPRLWNQGGEAGDEV